MPWKIAGMAISTMEESMVAMNIPMVTTESATHL